MKKGIMENVKKINMYSFLSSSHILYEPGRGGGREYLNTLLRSAFHADERMNIQQVVKSTDRASLRC